MDTKKLKKFFSKKNIVKLFACFGALVVVILVSYFVGKKATKKAEPTASPIEEKVLDVRVMKAQLKESSELTTAKLTLSGGYKYEGDGIPIISKEGFFIVYDADIRAGIDLDKVDIPEDKIDYTNKIIYITIPKAKLQGTPTIDANSIKLYAKNFVVFPHKTEEQTVEAIALAQDLAKKQAKKSGIIELANKQSETLVVGLLSKIAPKGYTIEVLKEEQNAKK